MSASCMAGNGMDSSPTDEGAYAYLKEAIGANPDLDFFLYAGSGGPSDAGAMRTQMACFAKQDAFLWERPK